MSTRLTPNELVCATGEALYHNPFTATLAETLADFKIHVEQSASLSERVPTHRVLIQEIGEVLSDPRVVKSREFTALGEQIDALRAADGRAGRLASFTRSHAERRHQIHARGVKQLALISEIGVEEDPVAIAHVARELDEVKDRLAFRSQQLRATQVLAEVNSQPGYLRNLLGPRPENRNLRVINRWQTAAEKIVGRRIDLGITGDTALGLDLETDLALARTVSSARQALGLGTPERGVHAGIGV